MENPLDNHVSFFNEFMVTLYLYTLMALTDFSSETMNYREECGWLLVSTVMASTGVNIAKFLYQVCPIFKKKVGKLCRRCSMAEQTAYDADAEGGNTESISTINAGANHVSVKVKRKAFKKKKLKTAASTSAISKK